jgi:hypothetical protein
MMVMSVLRINRMESSPKRAGESIAESLLAKIGSALKSLRSIPTIGSDISVPMKYFIYL